MTPTKVTNQRKSQKSPSPSQLKMSENTLFETPSSGTSTPEVLADQEFENDLDYLLSNKEKVSGQEEVYTNTGKLDQLVILDSFKDEKKKKPVKSNTSKKPKKFTVEDVTKDMEGLDFSSDDDDDKNNNNNNNNNNKPEESKPKEKKNTRLNKKRSERNFDRGGGKSDSRRNNNNNLRKSKSIASIRSKGDGKVEQQQQQQQQSSDDNSNSELVAKSNNKSQNSRRNRNRNGKKDDDNGVSSKDDTTKKSAEGNVAAGAGADADTTQDFEDGDTTIITDTEGKQETEEEILRRKLKNKKRKDRRKKQAAAIKKSEAEAEDKDKDKAEDETSSAEADTTTETVEQSGQAQSTPLTSPSKTKTPNTTTTTTTTKDSTPEAETNPFSIKLRSVKSSINKKYSENLSEVQPIKTIIGMSHQQILHSDLSDVKIKTLMNSSSISKYAANSVRFVTTHTNDLFTDYDKKKIFLTLCINVALYESLGFKKTVKIYPNVLELFGEYDEINLEKTRTKLTVSKKDIHQNNLDYSVLSYFGHILIWAVHQQRQGKVSIFTEKFDIVLTNNEVRSKIGGYHLWDKLFRELKGMNSKRWKHVIKFRNSFPYEEDQFMIILRFMQIDDNIP